MLILHLSINKLLKTAHFNRPLKVARLMIEINITGDSDTTTLADIFNEIYVFCKCI